MECSSMDSRRTGHQGFTEEEIARAEARIGARLPEDYRSYLKTRGLDAVNYRRHRLRPPADIVTTYQLLRETLAQDWREEFDAAIQAGNEERYGENGYFILYRLSMDQWSQVTDDYVLLWTENQGVWNAGYRLRDLQEGVPQPPVYISTEDDLITFRRCADRMEDFLLRMFQEAEPPVPARPIVQRPPRVETYHFAFTEKQRAVLERKQGQRPIHPLIAANLQEIFQRLPATPCDLQRALQRIKVLKIHNVPERREGTTLYLKSLPVLPGFLCYDDTAWEMIGEMPNLRRLNLSFLALPDYSFLPMCKNLRTLNLYGSTFTDCRLLLSLPSLKEVDLYACPLEHREVLEEASFQYRTGP